MHATVPGILANIGDKGKKAWLSDFRRVHVTCKKAKRMGRGSKWWGGARDLLRFLYISWSPVKQVAWNEYLEKRGV